MSNENCTIIRDLGITDKSFNDFPNDFPKVTGPPNKELAAAIALYIFTACEALDDFCISKNVFGGWNRVTCGHDFENDTCKWGAWESHCTSDFIAKCKERLPWVEIW
jgi:hypothetical protein